MICALFDASAARAAPPAITSIENAISHTTSGCSGAIVFTPQPGTQFQPLTINTPKGVESFYAKAARLNVHWLDTMTCTPRKSHAPISSSAYYSASNGSAISTNWSGWQIGNTAQFVQAGWLVPQVTLPNPSYVNYIWSGSEYDAAVWPGIGAGYPGGNSIPLIQSGTDSSIDFSGLTSYYFWWEIYDGTINSQGNQIDQLSVNHGDEVGATSVWIPNSDYTPIGTAMMGVCNFTTGWCIHFNKTNVPTPGNTTEWVVEAPSDINGDVYPIAKYGTVGMRNACWASTTNLNVTPGGVIGPVGGGASGTVTCHPITTGSSQLPLDLVQDLQNNWHALSTPGALDSSGTSFDVVYSLVNY